MRSLYEIATTSVGESYVRCYCWTDSEESARRIFSKLYPQQTILCVAVLFALSDLGHDFITDPNDCGFGEVVNLDETESPVVE